MLFNKKQGTFLADVISRWQADGVIDAEVKERLSNSFTVRPFDWARLARYSFLIAILCSVIAVGSVLADDVLRDFVENLFAAPDSLLAAVFAALAAVVFAAGLRMRRRDPTRTYSNEAVLFVAVLLAAAAIGFLGKALDNGSGHFSLLLLLAAVVYAGIGIWFQSKMVWTFALLSLGGWFGAETGYVSGWGVYYFGMSYPLRFVLFGAALTALSAAFARIPMTAPLRGVTFTVGLLYLFMALWLMSLYGNHDLGSRLARYDRSGALFWSLVFGAAALAAIWRGLRADDGVARGFGLTFLLINLYTKYFEYFWDEVHKAVFFAVLAVSFWLIGRRAEAIWRYKKS